MKLFRQIYVFFFTLFILLSLSSLKTAETIPKDIISSFKTGNSGQLSSFFNYHIELIVMGKSDVYNKTQAQIILKSFFKRNTPSNFVILNQSGSRTARFAIGILYTDKGNYKIYILGKINSNVFKIHQLRIEKDYG